MSPWADGTKSKQDLIAELAELRAQNALLKARLCDGESAGASPAKQLDQDADGRPIRMIGTIQDVTERKRAEEAMREREALLRAMSEGIPDPLFIKDRDSRMVIANTATVRATGKPPEQIIGHTDAEIFDDPAVARAMMDNDRRVMESGQPQAMEEFVPGPEGVRTFLSIKTPWRDAEGRIIGIIGCARDITDRKRAEEMASRSEERVRQAIGVAHLGIFEHDHRADVIYYSPIMREIMGFGPQEPITLASIIDHLVPEERETIAERIHRAHDPSGDGLYSVEHRVARPDGSIGWALAQSRTFFEDIGGVRRPVRTIGAAMDITERRRAEQALRESEASLAAAQRIAHVGSWEWDIATDTAKWSDETFRIFLGATRDTLQQHRKSFVDMVHPEDRRRVDQALTDALSGEREYDLDYRIRLPDGSEQTVHSQAEVLRSSEGKPILMRGTVHDITERKRAEEELRRRAEDLAAARTIAEQARAVADAANAAKDQFIATLSHELRTPLTPVLAAASVLKNDARLPQDAREDLTIIQRNIELETGLIDDLLDVTRIARGKVKLEKRAIDLLHVLREAAGICARDLDARGQRLSIETAEDSYPMLADPTRLQQAFWNLIKNATKFTPEGGQISIRAHSAGQSVIVEVADTGIGIDPEILPRLFSPFEQGDSGFARRFGGLGLGLAICKAVVDMHGGSIRARSAGRGKGASFVMELPLAPELGQALSDRARGQPAEPAKGQPSSARRLRILLVEDHADTARLMSKVLVADGHQVTIAGCVGEALGAMGRGDFDVLLSDLGLPDGTGHDLMRQVIAQGRAVKGIAISGYGTPEDIERSLDAGFAGHLVKPVTFQSLREALERIAEDGTR